MSKKLTPAIAKALAEKVRAELVVRHKGNTETITKKVEASKLYKELILSIKKIEELDFYKNLNKESINTIILLHQEISKLQDQNFITAQLTWR